MPFDPQPKDSGDLIRADDWNAAVNEIKRLETDKQTVTPDGQVRVAGGAEPVVKIQSDSISSISARLAFRQSNERGADLYFDGRDDVNGQSEAFVIATKGTTGPGRASQERIVVELSSGNVGIGERSPEHLLHVDGGAYCNDGVWANGCSRQYKTSIETLGQDTARAIVAALNPVTFRYRGGDGHDRVGFIAEEVPELVAQGDRKGLSPMDILAVVTRVVQDQQREIQDLRAQVSALAGTKAD